MKVKQMLTAVSVVAAALLISGCAGTVKGMRELPETAVPAAAPAGKSQIVFMRPATLGFAIQSSVFDVTNPKADPSLVGIIAAKTKVAHTVEPGKYTFMAVGESGDFMTAEVLPNKTYYVDVAPRMGLWKARFALEPNHTAELATAEFANDLKDCKWVELSPESAVWAQEHMPSVKSKYAEYYADWMKSTDEKMKLLPEDGR
jgi:hypothetical protein